MATTFLDNYTKFAASAIAYVWPTILPTMRITYTKNRQSKLSFDVLEFNLSVCCFYHSWGKG